MVFYKIKRFNLLYKSRSVIHDMKESWTNALTSAHVLVADQPMSKEDISRLGHNDILIMCKVIQAANTNSGDVEELI